MLTGTHILCGRGGKRPDRIIMSIVGTSLEKVLKLNIEPYYKKNIDNNDFILCVKKHIESIYYGEWNLSENIYENIFTITYRSGSQDPEILMADFERHNFRFFKYIASRAEVNKYLPFQHSGYYCVDCAGSERGRYIRDMTDLHIHAVVIVHPYWRELFLEGAIRMEADRVGQMDCGQKNRYLENGSNPQFYVAPIDPREADASRMISYSGKAILGQRGFYHGRESLFDFMGCKTDEARNKINLRASKRVTHSVRLESLTIS